MTSSKSWPKDVEFNMKVYEYTPRPAFPGWKILKRVEVDGYGRGKFRETCLDQNDLLRTRVVTEDGDLVCWSLVPLSEEDYGHLRSNEPLQHLWVD